MSEPTPTPTPTPTPDTAKELAEMKSKFEAQQKELEALKAKNNPDPKPDDLAEKAKKDREAAEKKAGETKILSSAIKFNHSAKDFIKNNASLLPESAIGIFAQAEKENYADEIKKANAIKVGVVSEFFALQDNLDLLTAAQQESLAEFKKLTKDIKEERVQGIYDSIFEPTLEMIRRVEKAKALQKGLVGDDKGDAYKKRVMEQANKHYLGVTK